MNRAGPRPDILVLEQRPAGPGRAQLSIAGRLDLAVAGLLQDWVEDICAAPLQYVGLDLAGLTPGDGDGDGTGALAAVCGALWARFGHIEIVGGATLAEPGDGSS